MAKMPYFKWYPADAEADEKYASMTDAQLGFYHRCLNRAWINDGLPGDLGHLARLLGRPTAYVKKMWEVVGECFSLEDSRFRNPRQEEERIDALVKRKKASDAAQERERRRIERSSSDPSNDTKNDHLRAYDYDYDSDSRSKESKIPKRIFDELWPEFVDVAKREGVDGSEDDWNEAVRVWSRLDFEQKQSAVEGLYRKFIGKENCLPVNYLRKKMWQRPERNTTQSSTGAESAAFRMLRERS